MGFGIEIFNLLLFRKVTSVIIILINLEGEHSKKRSTRVFVYTFCEKSFRISKNTHCFTSVKYPRQITNFGSSSVRYEASNYYNSVELDLFSMPTCIYFNAKIQYFFHNIIYSFVILIDKLTRLSEWLSFVIERETRRWR